MTDVTVLDGGMGKELHRIGAPFRQPEWSALALMKDPSTVRRAHDNFIEAGAEVIITNSYGIVPFHIGEERFAARGRELLDLAGRIAREAADAADHTVRVAGSVPPLFGSYRPELFEPDRGAELHRIVVAGLAPHVDIWLGETVSSTAEARSIVAAIGDDTRPIWMSFCLLDDADEAVETDPRLISGEPVVGIPAALRGLDAILFNCTRPEVIGPAIRALGGAVPAVPIGAYANAFPDEHDESYDANQVILGRREDLTPDAYADIVAGWIADGATIVGGCCGIHPVHIEELARRFGG